MPKVMKKFLWSADGIASEELQIGDEREFGDALEGLQKEGFVSGGAKEVKLSITLPGDATVTDKPKVENEAAPKDPDAPKESDTPVAPVEVPAPVDAPALATADSVSPVVATDTAPASAVTPSSRRGR